MESMLIALKYANEFKGYTINVSNCSMDCLKILCRELVGKDIKIVVLHRDIYTIDIKLKEQGQIFEDGNALWDFKGGVFL